MHRNIGGWAFYVSIILLVATLESSAFSVNRAFPPRSVIQSSPSRTSTTVALSMTSSVSALNEDESYSTAVHMSSNKDVEKDRDGSSLRDRLRKITGFSLTAFRATMRAATGISLTALYASALAATSAFVRKTMAIVLSPLPPWVRILVVWSWGLCWISFFVVSSTCSSFLVSILSSAISHSILRTAIHNS